MNIDERRVKLVIDFIENLYVPDGADAGRKRIVLRPWQKSILRDVYGPRDEQGNRIVKQATLSFAKKNAKTTLVAALTLVHLCGPEAIRNGQLFSAAKDRSQASIIFKLMAKMIRMDPYLSSILNVIESRKTIIDSVSGSEYTALSSESATKHGYSPSFLAFDELAQFLNDDELYSTLALGTGAHIAPMTWIISTQAPNDSAVLSRIIDDGMKIMSGEVEDPSIRCYLFTVPMDADIFDEEIWSLANPALGDFRSLDDMRRQAEQAKRMPEKEAAFRNLLLNQRVLASGRFIPKSIWDANSGEADEDAFFEYPVTGGLDLSQKNDLTAFVISCKDSNDIVHAKSYFWAPGDTLIENGRRDGVRYDAWRDSGDLYAPPGKIISYKMVAKKISEVHHKYNLSGIRFDRWHIDLLLEELKKIEPDVWVEGRDTPIQGGIRLIPHGMGYKDMSPAVQNLEDILLEERLRCGGKGHCVLTMCAANARVERDSAGGRKFDKVKSTGRIDGLVALSISLPISDEVQENDLEKALLSRGVYSIQDW